MPIKTCVGAVLYSLSGKIFLMTSPKWNGYIVPGGRIEDGETEERALRREINEELAIEISDLVRLGESEKQPSKDFIDPKMGFHFITYAARAMQTDITPNEEILTYGWYTIDEDLKLPLVDSARKAIEGYKRKIKEKR